jgi:hypothetical protein
MIRSSIYFVAAAEQVAHGPVMQGQKQRKREAP